MKLSTAYTLELSYQVHRNQGNSNPFFITSFLFNNLSSFSIEMKKDETGFLKKLVKKNFKLLKKLKKIISNIYNANQSMCEMLKTKF